MENRRRVVITGLGVVCSLGQDTETFWSALRAGTSGIGPIAGIDGLNLRFQNGAQMRDFDPLRHFDGKQLDLMDPFAQIGVVAARQAVADAGRSGTAPELDERTVITTGSCLGGRASDEQSSVDLYVNQRKGLHPLSVPRVMANAAASLIAIDFGLHGPTFNLSTACASANHAMGLAYQMIRHGMADSAITGGSETPFHPVHLKAWEAIRAVSPDTCRPFSRDRRGMILGEGGAMLVLETLDAARARGAHIYAEIVGFGMSADGSHLTRPQAEGAARAIRSALADADIVPEAVGYVNAHGTGTQANDPMETAAIRSVFGDHADRLAISSTKSMHGHALGASGALEAVATALALQHGVLPPTANFTEPDPECDLDVIPNEARLADVDYALSNAFAFGGLNAVLAFRRWSPAG